MSKTKEYYMKITDCDIEREYLFNDILAQEQQYYEEQKFLNSLKNKTTKIEINDRTDNNSETRIEVSGSKEPIDNEKIRGIKPGL